MKENASIHQKSSSSLESNDSMMSMAPPSFGLEASSLGNMAPAPGGAIQLMADSSSPIQRVADMRDDYPWQGVVDNPNGALFMEYSDRCTADDFMVPHGTRVTVLGAVGEYYHVQYQGREGYLEKDKVDDVVANHIEETMVGDQMDWQPSGPAGRTDFARAARDNTQDANGDYNTPMPDGSPNSLLNCWEMILLAALQTGVLSRDTVHNWYRNGNIEAMMPGVDGTYVVGNGNNPQPQRGDIVFMQGLNHVVIAQGELSTNLHCKVWSFWPPSDFTPAQARAALAPGGAGIDSISTGRIQDTTLEELANWMIQMNMDPNPIT
ncbi:MAG TPA: hypothetical protein ENJ82_06985, partial [Bacteroidetes bacterium]|nr:hypothetical protein [Bacteroidota bacterium]